MAENHQEEGLRYLEILSIFSTAPLPIMILYAVPLLHAVIPLMGPVLLLLRELSIFPTAPSQTTHPASTVVEALRQVVSIDQGEQSILAAPLLLTIQRSLLTQTVLEQWLQLPQA
ncbi:MAG: hypothetical protein A2984_01970 [Omnitrophica WOR_2 bacterium RIFCSPLOWO2_01_FULL_41_12]|nr:MAG: hypothetical protein A2984_01970 [Omnitrophica WOR_2 bacterium RIFCSPLOWO2_01_FULL_41_12]